MSENVYSGVAPLLGRCKGVCLDAYGVFWGGNRIGVLPQADQLMKQMVSSGLKVVILSNSSQLSCVEKEKFTHHGLLENIHWHAVITSGEIARKAFLQKELPIKRVKNRFFLLGPPHPKFLIHTPIFSETGFTETKDPKEADFIFISTPHIGGEDQVESHLFRPQVEEAVRLNLPFICTNPDLVAQEGAPPRLVIRQGSIAHMCLDLGAQVHFFGKPYRPAFYHALGVFKQLGVCSPKDILMIGDTPETDIRGAKSVGMQSALITNFGVFAERATTVSEEGPDFYVKHFRS